MLAAFWLYGSVAHLEYGQLCVDYRYDRNFGSYACYKEPRGMSEQEKILKSKESWLMTQVELCSLLLSSTVECSIEM